MSLLLQAMAVHSYDLWSQDFFDSLIDDNPVFIVHRVEQGNIPYEFLEVDGFVDQAMFNLQSDDDYCCSKIVSACVLCSVMMQETIANTYLAKFWMPSISHNKME